MGFFTKPEQTVEPASLPAPLDRDRIRAYLDSQGLHHLTDEDGDVWGWWDQHPVYFLLLGAREQALFLRAQWNRRVPLDQLGAVLALANEWGQRQPWPNVYVREGEEYLDVFAHHTVAYENGLSEERLADHVTCGIETSLAFFAHLDEHYPDAVADARERLGEVPTA
jgi:hypothetical protein